jgi:hypothetical protein
VPQPPDAPPKAVIRESAPDVAAERVAVLASLELALASVRACLRVQRDESEWPPVAAVEQLVLPVLEVRSKEPVAPPRQELKAQPRVPVRAWAWVVPPPVQDEPRLAEQPVQASVLPLLPLALQADVPRPGELGQVDARPPGASFALLLQPPRALPSPQ